VADLGGEGELSTLEKATAGHLGDIHTTLRLLVNDLVVRGMFTPAGNPRKTYDAFLKGLDRWDRYCQRLGLKRRARHVNIAAALAQLHEEDPDVPQFPEP
jgi:hypothetical protein